LIFSSIFYHHQKVWYILSADKAPLNLVVGWTATQFRWWQRSVLPRATPCKRSAARGYPRLPPFGGAVR